MRDEQSDLFPVKPDGAALRDAGIQAATEHADRVVASWSDQAYAFAEAYARAHPRFTAEDVRQASAGTVPAPPSLKAWGGIFLRLARAGLVVRDGFATARDPKVHCNVVTLWRSTAHQVAA